MHAVPTKHRETFYIQNLMKFFITNTLFQLVNNLDPDWKEKLVAVERNNWNNKFKRKKLLHSCSLFDHFNSRYVSTAAIGPFSNV